MTRKVKGLCEHCGKTRTYNLNELDYLDDDIKCKFCNKSGNLKEV